MSTWAQHSQDSVHYLWCEWVGNTMTKTEDVKWWPVVHIKAAWVCWVNSLRTDTSRMRTKVMFMCGPSTVLKVSSELILTCGSWYWWDRKRNWENYWSVQRDFIYINFCKILLFEQGLILVTHACFVMWAGIPSYQVPWESHPGFLSLTTFLCDSRGHRSRGVRVGGRSSVSGNRESSWKALGRLPGTH